MNFDTSNSNFGTLECPSLFNNMNTTTFQDDTLENMFFFDFSTDLLDEFLFQENFFPQAQNHIEYFPSHEDFEVTSSLKRQKCYDSDASDTYKSVFCGYNVYENTSPYEVSPYPPYPLQFQAPPQVFHNEKLTSVANNSVSPQSIAARLRRKKISEKTTELSKIIPGGSKMNTAEMFQASFNYVKFMQAQIGILQSMPLFQEVDNPELQALVTLPSIQEKLYSKEKCLVPTEFVKVLAKDEDLRSIPSISNTLDQLIH